MVTSIRKITSEYRGDQQWRSKKISWPRMGLPKSSSEAMRNFCGCHDNFCMFRRQLAWHLPFSLASSAWAILLAGLVRRPCRVVMVLQAGNHAKPYKVCKWPVFFLRHFVKHSLFVLSYTKSYHELPQFLILLRNLIFTPFTIFSHWQQWYLWCTLISIYANQRYFICNSMPFFPPPFNI